MVQGWSKAIDSFLVDFDTDICIAGSNTYLLSSEFSTLLSGRYVEIRMFPLSFREFLDFNTFASDAAVEEKFQKYLQFGGMPTISEYDFNQERINDVLQGIYSTVILKDVLERNKITDQTLLKKIVAFLADDVGNIVSPNSISNFLVSTKTERTLPVEPLRHISAICRTRLSSTVHSVMTSRVSSI